MKIKTLRQTHPTYDASRWAELEALSKGGRLFHAMIRHFLPVNAVEPAEIYQTRIKQAHYHSYTAAITNLYVGWLFAADFTVKPHSKTEAKTIDNTDDFYGLFQEDVGDETTFSAFTRERFREALTTGKSHYLIQLPSDGGIVAGDKKEWEDRQLGRATLKNIENCEVLDWMCDDKGQFEWVILHDKDTVRKLWSGERDTVIEQWRVYDKANCTTFKIEYPANKPPSDDTEVTDITEAPHGFGRVPLMTLTMPEQLCIGEQTRDPQIEHFRLNNALSWLIRRTCYAQPVFNLEDGDSIPTMGTGYGIVLAKDDKFGWTSPPVAPFDVLQKNVEATRDEIFRVTHTMAQSVDNNAETVGRSADSKEIDAAATRIMLQAYASYVSKCIEETYETISEARGEKDYEWSVEGFSGYDTATVASLIANCREARALGIPSQSLHKELSIKVSNAMFAGADQRLKEVIRAEIASADFSKVANPVSYENDLEAAKAEELRAKAEAVLQTADATTMTAEASTKTAEASMISAKSKPAGAAKAKGAEPPVAVKKKQKYSPEYGR